MAEYSYVKSTKLVLKGTKTKRFARGTYKCRAFPPGLRDIQRF
ncbi:FRG1 isoform 4 [Pan troglodytes]|uniref:FRG1 isoform 4 n=1 Tax=Pan troglodytes TaxID=9598 RepID=A0A2J8IQ26_PANTR|nr:FRG1 isoform 4 [Pan troglodytes]